MKRAARLLYRLSTPLFLLLIAWGCGGGPTRAERSMPQMLSARTVDDAERMAEGQALVDGMLIRAKAEHDAHARRSA
ncbi:MAG: hypothetical protein WBD40_00100, partial [Tepidisphaeraceae bacterium]